jgi:hypothetical protein
VSSRYVIAKTSGYADVTFPNGIMRQHIYAGHRYLATDAVVQQHLELFVAYRHKVEAFPPGSHRALGVSCSPTCSRSRAPTALLRPSWRTARARPPSLVAVAGPRALVGPVVSS